MGRNHTQRRMLGCHPLQIQRTDPSLFSVSLSLEFPLIMCQLTQCSTYMHVRTQAHTKTHTKLRGHRRAWRREKEFGRGQLEDIGGGGLSSGYSFCPRQYRQAWQPISASQSHPHHPTSLAPSPLLSLALVS